MAKKPSSWRISDRILSPEAAGLSHSTQPVSHMAILLSFLLIFFFLLCGVQTCEVWLWMP